MSTIYIKLLNEDIEVWRPVSAEKDILKEAYLILKSPINQIPEGEVWEFLPGNLVKVKEKLSDGQKILIAYELVRNI